MPYYLFKIETRDPLGRVKNLEFIRGFDKFREARARARQLRREPSDAIAYKIMFAENQLSAELMLQEKRERPVLMEHER